MQRECVRCVCGGVGGRVSARSAPAAFVCERRGPRARPNAAARYRFGRAPAQRRSHFGPRHHAAGKPSWSSAAVPCCPCLAIGHRKRLESSRLEMRRGRKAEAAGSSEKRGSQSERNTASARAPGRRNNAACAMEDQAGNACFEFRVPEREMPTWPCPAATRCCCHGIRAPVVAPMLRWCSDAPVLLQHQPMIGQTSARGKRRKRIGSSKPRLTSVV